MTKYTIPEPPDVLVTLSPLQHQFETLITALKPLFDFGYLYGEEIIIALFSYWFIRFVIISFMRALGLYAPSQYHLWPRLPWRIIYRFFFNTLLWFELTFSVGKKHTGGFCSALETINKLYKPYMLHLGRATTWGVPLLQPVGIDVKRHILMLAMNGAGKTTALATSISEWRGSVFLIDPKSQIVDALADKDSKKWYVFDPDSLSKSGERISINVFDCIKEAITRKGEEAAVLWANRLSEALIRTPSGSTSPFFYDTPRLFTTGLILHILTHHPKHEHHLGFLRDLIIHGYQAYDEHHNQITQGNDSQIFLLTVMSENKAFGGVISGAAKSMLEAGVETLGNLRATLIEQTKFLDIPNVRNVIKKSDISLADLKTRDDIVLAFTASIYSLQEELNRLSRLLTNMIAYTFEAVEQKQGQCLAVIDELPSQHYNPTIETMLATSRSMGLTLVAVSQNIELLQKHYPNSYKSFIGEADAVIWMGGNHHDNNETLRKILGSKTQKSKLWQGKKEEKTVDVMDTEQIKRHLDPNSNRMIVTFAGQRATRLINDPYFKALKVTQYNPDSQFGDTFLRQKVRAFIQQFYQPSS